MAGTIKLNDPAIDAAVNGLAADIAAADRKWREKHEVAPGITSAMLDDAFARVHDPDDWKAPIAAIIRASELPLVTKAIEYHTATTVKVVDSWRPFKNREPLLAITAQGYRAGPAGDH